MPYDFDRLIDRRHTNSLKWHIAENELPMWVADMDFAAPPVVAEALQDCLRQEVFGYQVVPPAWGQAYCDWWQSRHGWQMQPEWLTFCTGVVPAISSAVRKLTAPGDLVLVQTPVYNIFFNSILNNGRRPLQCPLRVKKGRYEMDLEELERRLADPRVALMLLCNPHNPTGNCWDAETLAAVGQLARRHNVTVLADEIHCDLTLPGVSYTPFASVSDDCRAVSVTCLAPTKTFNLAGLQTAAVAVPEQSLRRRMVRALNTDEVAEPNAFAVAAAVAAFTGGADWLDELREYLAENRRLTEEFCKTEIPRLRVTHGEATYLVWLNAHDYTKNDGLLAQHLRQSTGLVVSNGSQYGSGGEGFLRLNIACPRSRLQDGLTRLAAGLASFREEG